ncbi:hypothetical protein Metev_2334 (plasmid) [Methanohalobium evestigatum Z-7303]|uniref:Uncharacterized protein n=1 Tax=Methanohalobium evestigatum (strain ATCC BAA-1072 / DSM 3721 / NBRC 107634 / OCM 161 / Z-7303) TaxID=644295 RepID=D7EC24_METEZ|nr:hypothetical protein Metev_2334 [Methanohalobium evestigatum Z-7303]
MIIGYDYKSETFQKGIFLFRYSKEYGYRLNRLFMVLPKSKNNFYKI